MKLVDLGAIMVANFGLAYCVKKYGTDNLPLIGSHALTSVDIFEDGELN